MGQRVAVVLVAAGRGARAGLDRPKQYWPLAGKTLAARTLEALAASLPGAIVQPVIHPQDAADFAAAAASVRDLDLIVRDPAQGGETRQDSVRAGLQALDEEDNFIVLIHDIARPFLSYELCSRLVTGAANSGACIPVLNPVDALAAVDARGFATGPVDRNSVRAVQTPQAFRLGLIRDAHRDAHAAGVTGLADDAAVALWAGIPVATCPGDPGNIKLTHPEDFALAENRLLSALPDVRMGTGFDVHAFAPGDHVALGGLRIAHTHGLAGHSDADVLLHALTDALLGALADGDIGSHFPPSDPQWKGAASRIFLEHAVKLVQARGGAIAHLDATVICEAPKIGPHRDALRASVASICGLDPARVSIKATTTEKLGFTGRREGIAAQAAATIRLP